MQNQFRFSKQKPSLSFSIAFTERLLSPILNAQNGRKVWTLVPILIVVLPIYIIQSYFTISALTLLFSFYVFKQFF